MRAESIFIKYMAEISDPPEEHDLAVAVNARARIATIDDNAAVVAADRKLIKLTKYAPEDALVPLSGDRWFQNLRAIARGEYPLDQLPEHVRDLAAELYYD